MPASFVEGPEKKVELVVVGGRPSLRALGEARWRAVAGAAGAEVLSMRSNERFDAYLLSESSLFVFDDFVTMITCGQTTLVDAVEATLGFVDARDVAALVYERKHEHFPSQQRTSFFDDARRLNAMLPGRAVQLGSVHEHSVSVFYTTRPYAPEPADTTLEILMHGIDPDAVVRLAPGDPAGSVSTSLGLDRLLSGYELDEHVFSPSGYSFNAMRGATYMTLHATPERLGSYVSFETNAPLPEATGTVDEVVGRFAPESLDLILFTASPSDGPLTVPGYAVRKHVQERLGGYHVTFLHLFRPPTGAVGGMALEL